VAKVGVDNFIWEPVQRISFALTFFQPLVESVLQLQLCEQDDHGHCLADHTLSDLGLLLLSNSHSGTETEVAELSERWRERGADFLVESGCVLLPLHKQDGSEVLGNLELRMETNSSHPLNNDEVKNLEHLEIEFGHLAHPLERVLLAFPRKRYALYILAATKLAVADTFSKR
jgi:hypothetical protein